MDERVESGGRVRTRGARQDVERGKMVAGKSRFVKSMHREM